MYKLDGLLKKKVGDLKKSLTKLNLKKFEKLNKADLVYKILDEQSLPPCLKRKNLPLL